MRWRIRMQRVQTRHHRARDDKRDRKRNARDSQRERLDGWPTDARNGFPKNASDPEAQSLRSLMSIECHGKPPLASAVLLKPEKRGSVSHRIWTDLQREIVAAKLALVADAIAHPPNGWMKEEQRLDQGLHQVAKEVGAAHVGQFVRQYHFKFIRTEQRDRRKRQQHHATDRTHCDGPIGRTGYPQKHRPAKPHCCADASKAITESSKP